MSFTHVHGRFLHKCMQDFFADVQASFYTCECKIFSHVQVRALHMYMQDLCTCASKSFAHGAKSAYSIQPHS